MILILGSDSESTGQFYKTLGLAPSVLVSDTSHLPAVAHTSPQAAGDFFNLQKIAELADTIYFANPSVEDFPSQDYYFKYLHWLKELEYRQGNVKNLKIGHDYFNWSKNLPSLNENDAVFIGCSFTQGIGLTQLNQRYSNIVSEYFNLNCVNLAKSGTSNAYFFETFSKLDFKPGQLVVLQLTVLERIRYIEDQGKLLDLRFSANTNNKIIKVFNYEYLFYELLVKLNLISKIAQSKKLKLVIWIANYNEEFGQTYTLEQQLCFYNYKEIVPLFLSEHYIVDFGTDNAHPGPESNKKIAKVLIEFIEKTYGL